MSLVTLTENGLYCPAGGFHVDPWRAVDRAVITHAHGDHARHGHARYLCPAPGRHVLRARVGADAAIDTVEYGERVLTNGVVLSLHPAGHVLGSCQVRIEHRGEVWVISGDYKTDADPTCAPFEPVRAHTFVTESTFGLPVYRWRPAAEVFAEIDQWWRDNQAAGRASVLYAYAFGKAQRVLAGIDAGIGPLLAHGALGPLNAAYAASGVPLPPVRPVGELPKDFDYSRALVIAPPSAQGSPWLRRLGDFADAFVSGWMQIRGARRRRAVDRGFALSDHADWPGLNAAIAATGAGRVLVTHGYTAVMVRHLREQGLDAAELETRFEGERDDEADAAAEPPAT